MDRWSSDNWRLSHTLEMKPHVVLVKHTCATTYKSCQDHFAVKKTYKQTRKVNVSSKIYKTCVKIKQDRFQDCCKA